MPDGPIVSCSATELPDASDQRHWLRRKPAQLETRPTEHWIYCTFLGSYCSRRTMLGRPESPAIDVSGSLAPRGVGTRAPCELGCVVGHASPGRTKVIFIQNGSQVRPEHHQASLYSTGAVVGPEMARQARNGDRPRAATCQPLGALVGPYRKKFKKGLCARGAGTSGLAASASQLILRGEWVAPLQPQSIFRPAFTPARFPIRHLGQPPRLAR